MLYEFGLHLHMADLFKLLILILPICIYLFSSNFENKIARRVTVAASCLSAFVILAVVFIAPIYSYFKINHYIKTDSLLTVDGVVADFETSKNSFGGHNSESFKIDSVEFEYYGTENYGYSKFLCDGGVINGNGQKLKISYCYDPITKEKVICYIKNVE